jgi:hypothetical protein
MSDVNEMEVFDWDDEIQDDGEEMSFVTLEPGDYPFEIIGFERGFHEAKPGGKAPSCKKAIIKIKISTADGDAIIKENFLLYKAMEWKLSQFFRCVGLKKHGEKLKMLWDKTPGCTGVAKITKDPGKEPGVFFNHVKAWLEPKEGDNEWS